MNLLEALSDRLRMADECSGGDYNIMAEWALGCIEQWNALDENRDAAIERVMPVLRAFTLPGYSDDDLRIIAGKLLAAAVGGER